MRVGYARVSTREQHIDAQVGRLADCERVFFEKESGGKAARARLEECLNFVREGDTLVTTRLDRLARSVAHLCAIAETLEHKGVALVVIDQAIDTTTPTGKLLFHLLAAIAEFELSIRKEQQRAGIAHARSMGKSTGRPCRLNQEERAELCALAAEGTPTPTLARRYRIAPRTVRRYAAAGPPCGRT